MIKSVLYLFSIALLLFLSGCGNSASVDKKALFSYIGRAGNGLIQKELRNGVTYCLKYRPNDIIIEQELQVHPQLDKDSLRKCYSGCRYFVLSLSKDGNELFSSVSQDFNALLKTISFELKKEIRLIQNGSEFQLTDFVFARTFITAPYSSVLLCFKNEDLTTSEDLVVSIKDFVNQNTEELKFRFRKEDLNTIPSLKL